MTAQKVLCAFVVGDQCAKLRAEISRRRRASRAAPALSAGPDSCVCFPAMSIRGSDMISLTGRKACFSVFVMGLLTLMVGDYVAAAVVRRHLELSA